MTFRKLFVVGAAMAALGFAGAAIAQTSAQKAQIDQAKAAGETEGGQGGADDEDFA